MKKEGEREGDISAYGETGVSALGKLGIPQTRQFKMSQKKTKGKSVKNKNHQRG